MEFLIEQDQGYINCRNYDEETPLVLAGEAGLYDVIPKLIEAGADVNLCSETTSSLHEVVRRPKLVQLLLSHGADINKRDIRGHTPLHKAVIDSNLESVCTLLYYNADVNIIDENQLTPFMISLIKDNVEIQHVLFDYVYDFNMCTKEDYTTFELALRYNSPFAQQMLYRGVNIRINAFYCLMKNYEINEVIFKQIWDNLKYNKSKPIVVSMICRSSFGSEKFERLLNIMIESSNIELLMRSTSNMSIDALVSCAHYNKCNIEVVSRFVLGLVEYGYTLDFSNIHTIFNCYPGCELVKILRYWTLRPIIWADYLHPSYIILRFMFDVENSIKEIKTHFYMYYDTEEFDVLHFNAMKFNYDYIFEFCSDRKLVSLFEYDFPEEVLPSVPKLVELSRDAARESIISRFNVHKACDYYKILDQLDICEVYKDILRFDKKIYKI